MINNKLYKWLFSLTLLISLTSFSGIVHEQVKPVNTITEVIVSNSNLNSTYNYSFTTQTFVPELSSFYGFNFKAFIHSQNNHFSQKEKMQNSIVLELKNITNTTYLKAALISNIDDFPFHF